MSSEEDSAGPLNTSLKVRRLVSEAKARLAETRAEQRALEEVRDNLKADEARLSHSLEAVEAECERLAKVLEESDERVDEISTATAEAENDVREIDLRRHDAENRIREISGRIQLLEAELDGYRTNTTSAQTTVHGAMNAMVRMNYKLSQGEAEHHSGREEPTPGDPNLDR